MSNQFEMQDGDLPLLIADSSILFHYKQNLYSPSDIPIKRLTLKILEKTIREGCNIVAVPFTHYRAILETANDQKAGLEFQSFLSFAHIFPENSKIFAEAPIKTAQLCKSLYPKRKVYLLSLDSSTQKMARDTNIDPLELEKAVEILG